jgi:Zn-dependent protease with chaperone function
MMTPSLWSIFVVNVVINSFLAFLTISLLIVLSLNLLRIKSARLQAFCLCLPFVKLLFDLASYQFSNWALAQQLNPLISPEGTRFLSISVFFPFLKFPLCSIQLHLQEGQAFTIADIFCLKAGCSWTFWSALLMLGGAVWKYRISCQWLHKMKNSSQLCIQTIKDPFLHSFIQRKRVAIYLTEILHAPCIISQHQPSIFLSHTFFNQLTSQEFEAIIAHEIAHLRHGDLILNAFLFWISHFFWWIPTSYITRKLELAQEYACDRLLHTSLHQHNLAEALYKAARWLHSAQIPALAYPMATSHHIVTRINVILKLPTESKSKMIEMMKSFFLLLCMITLMLGKLWTF